MDAEGKVEVSQKGGKGKVTISIDSGKHRLKIEREGFTVFGEDFEMKSGGTTSITAKLVPLDEKPAVVGTKPALVPDLTKKPLFLQTPEFEPWANEVAVMPAEQQGVCDSPVIGKSQFPLKATLSSISKANRCCRVVFAHPASCSRSGSPMILVHWNEQLSSTENHMALHFNRNDSTIEHMSQIRSNNLASKVNSADSKYGVLAANFRFD